MARGVAAWGGQLTDWATTCLFLAYGGMEANPLLQPVVHDWRAFFAVKVLATGLVIAAAVKWGNPQRTHRVLTVAVLVSVFAVTWNLASMVIT